MHYELVDFEGSTLASYQTESDAQQGFTRHVADEPSWMHEAFLVVYDDAGSVTRTVSYAEFCSPSSRLIWSQSTSDASQKVDQGALSPESKLIAA